MSSADRNRQLAEVSRLLEDQNANVRSLAEELVAHGLDRGCSAYVKTIYVGLELGGEMVAALYPHANSIELALALAEDTPHDGLIDATHLTWRTMPVAVVFSSEADLQRVSDLLDEAIARVGDGSHDVELPTEAFMGRDRRLASRRILGRSD